MSFPTANSAPPTNDARFLSELLDQVIAQHSTGDPKVYVIGTSNGGFMAQRLADEMPEKLDASTEEVWNFFARH